MKLWFAVAIACVVVCSAAIANDNNSDVPLEVTYCQLVGNPAAYLGKRVVVRAIYEYGFEVQVLKSPACCSGGESKFGVAFGPDMDDHSQRLFHKLDQGMGTALAVFVGTFQEVSNASSQLPSGERFQLAVDRLKKVEKSARWRGGKPVWVPKDCGARRQ